VRVVRVENGERGQEVNGSILVQSCKLKGGVSEVGKHQKPSFSSNGDAIKAPPNPSTTTL